MRKDTALAWVFIFTSLYFLFQSRYDSNDIHKDYKNYQNHDMNTIRPIPANVKKTWEH